jgi:hypothetical protein
MFEIIKETTEWACDFVVPNHTYLINKAGTILAYENCFTGEILIIKSKLKLDKRYRKFVKVKNPKLEILKKNYKSDPDEKVFIVKSKDKEYSVVLKNGTYSCNCLGFTYRGKCKHTDSFILSKC